MGLYSKLNKIELKGRGETSLFNGERISKNSTLINFIGTVDELNSHLGLVKALLSAENQGEDHRQFIEEIQKNLMKLMSHVSDTSDERYFFNQNDVIVLEKEIGRLSAKLPKQSKFVIPGHNVFETQIHIARTVARRAERSFFAVDELRLCQYSGIFLNKLSDYLFLLSQNFTII